MPWTKEALRIKNKRKKTEYDKGNIKLSFDESTDEDEESLEVGTVGTDGSLFNSINDPYNVCNEGGISIDIDDETGEITPS